MLERVRAGFLRYADAAPRRAAFLRYALTLLTVAAAVAIIPRTPIDGPVGGIVVVLLILTACWYGGPGPALFCPIMIYLVTRLMSPEEPKPFTPTGREVMTMVIMTVLTIAVGLAGQYRRQLSDASRRYLSRIQEQSQALGLARILFRELDGRITVWTSGTEKLFGWTSAEATGRVLEQLLKSRYPQPLDEIRRELLLTGQWQGEVVHHHKDGTPLTIVTHCILYSGAEGGGGRVAEVHTDVTRQRQAEAELREADHRKDVFIATLAHELRNPLAPVRSGLDLLQLSCEPDEESRSVMDMMGRQLNHMVRLIDDLLDIGRINTGKVTLCRQLVSLDEIVRDAVASVRPHLDATRQELSIQLPPTPVTLNADPARIAQVLTNLLNNAAKFTPAEGKIWLTARLHDRELEIEVRDNGSGITADALPHIFKMFAQAEHLHTRTHAGLGIGLSIVKALVEMHGGSVSCHSEGRGAGSRFVVRLPCLTSSPARPGSQAPAPHEVNGRAHSRRVLVVDDNQDAARLLAETLRRHGLDCREAYDGQAALKAAAEFDPEVFILDLGMPGMSGYDLARSLRSDRRFTNALLIAATGWDKEEDRRQSRSAGFDHHLAKPVDLQTLQGMISSVKCARPPLPTHRVERLV